MSAGLAGAGAVPLAYAALLTRTPAAVNERDIDGLREVGLSDLDILDLNNVVAYYNYINRIVMGLGLRTVMSTEHEALHALPR